MNVVLYLGLESDEGSSSNAVCLVGQKKCCIWIMWPRSQCTGGVCVQTAAPEREKMDVCMDMWGCMMLWIVEIIYWSLFQTAQKATVWLSERIRGNIFVCLLFLEVSPHLYQLFWKMSAASVTCFCSCRLLSSASWRSRSAQRCCSTSFILKLFHEDFTVIILNSYLICFTFRLPWAKQKYMKCITFWANLGVNIL